MTHCKPDYIRLYKSFDLQWEKFKIWKMKLTYICGHVTNLFENKSFIKSYRKVIQKLRLQQIGEGVHEMSMLLKNSL